MPSIKPRLTDGTNILTDTAGAHLIGPTVQAYTGPPAPENLSYDPATGTLSFDPVTSATQYHVFASDPAAAEPEALAEIATITALTYAASVLANADRRVFAVVAEDEYVLVRSNLSKPAFAMGSERRTQQT